MYIYFQSLLQTLWYKQILIFHNGVLLPKFEYQLFDPRSVYLFLYVFISFYMLNTTEWRGLQVILYIQYNIYSCIHSSSSYLDYFLYTASTHLYIYIYRYPYTSYTFINLQIYILVFLIYILYTSSGALW